MSKIFRVSRNTIYNWFNNWESCGLVGLYNHSGQGRKKIFNLNQQEIIKEWVKETPKNLGLVQEKIHTQWGVTASKDTIKRVIKFAQMRWYRIKRRVGGEPVPSFYTRKIKELEKLKQQEQMGKIEIRYVDETGFCLIPYIPYAWQESQQKIEVKSQKSKRLNVLGFLTRQNELEVYTFQCSINSDVIIACIDKFCEKITKKTVLIMDNSSIHQHCDSTSGGNLRVGSNQNSFLWDKEEEWANKGLEIFFLPTYSPELNIIEILWRFIKYQWLEINAYFSYSALVKAVEDILINFGTKYTINFA